jgi:hypothetical protein
MAKRRRPVNDEVAGRLERTPARDSPNHISAQKLKQWAVDYLVDYDDELARYPDLAGQAHWNLWMIDARYQDALFAVLVFRADGMEFFCGTGNAHEVKRFAERDFPDNPDEVFGMMAAKFSIPEGSVRTDRRPAEEWIGRGW